MKNVVWLYDVEGCEPVVAQGIVVAGRVSDGYPQKAGVDRPTRARRGEDMGAA